MCSEAELGNAERSSPAKLFDPAIHFTLLEDGACIQGANAVSLGTQANPSFVNYVSSKPIHEQDQFLSLVC